MKHLNAKIPMGMENVFIFQLKSRDGDLAQNFSFFPSGDKKSLLFTNGDEIRGAVHIQLTTDNVNLTL